MNMDHEPSNREADTLKEPPYPLDLCRHMSERSPMPLIAVEGSTHLIRYVNPAFCRLAETHGEDLMGKPFAVLVPESEAKGCLSVLDSVYRTGGAESLADQPHRRATVEPSYWSFNFWPILDAKDRPAGVMIQVTDTTAENLIRQQLGKFNQTLLLSGLHQQELTEVAETVIERLQRFMHETDHRAKNNLQIIVALLDMQIMENPEVVSIGVLAQLRLHIQTVASFHDLLTRLVKDDGKESTVSATAILSKLLPMWQKIVGEEEFRWNAEEIVLPVKKGMSLALLTNEIITNAIKHGAREVDLKFVQRENSATLTVSDDGPGFPPDFDPSTSANFGLEFIESVVRLELRGQVNYGNNSHGACVKVVFPIL